MATYTEGVAGTGHTFHGIVGSMAKATPFRSFDELAGCAATSDAERAAGQWALAEVSLATFVGDIAPDSRGIAGLTTAAGSGRPEVLRRLASRLPLRWSLQSSRQDHAKSRPDCRCLIRRCDVDLSGCPPSGCLAVGNPVAAQPSDRGSAWDRNHDTGRVRVVPDWLPSPPKTRCGHTDIALPSAEVVPVSKFGSTARQPCAHVSIAVASP